MLREVDPSVMMKASQEGRKDYICSSRLGLIRREGNARTGSMRRNQPGKPGSML